MTTRTYKIYGFDGHRQRNSFGESVKYNWSTAEHTRIVEVERADKTNTNDYVIIRITCDSAEECERELYAQLDDGIMENDRYGRIEEI